METSENLFIQHILGAPSKMSFLYIGSSSTVCIHILTIFKTNSYLHFHDNRSLPIWQVNA